MWNLESRRLVFPDIQDPNNAVNVNGSDLFGEALLVIPERDVGDVVPAITQWYDNAPVPFPLENRPLAVIHRLFSVHGLGEAREPKREDGDLESVGADGDEP